MDEVDLKARLGVVKMEHRDLDHAIGALVESGAGDQLRHARLKKRKLVLRDEIVRIEGLLIPDILA